MSDAAADVQFVVKPVTATGGASEFRQSMVPHPLVHQELPHDPDFGIYNRRLRSLSYGSRDAGPVLAPATAGHGRTHG